MAQHIPRPHLSMALTSFAAEDPGGWTALRERAALYDRCGVDRLAVSDHVVFGEALHDYARPELGGQAGGVQPTGPDGHWLEPLTTLSFIAGFTTRVRLATNILLAALRRPAVLAKTAATLDVLSGGRLDLGIGVGWQEAEYTAAGLSFASRGALLDQSLEICRTLWTDRTASYTSPALSFDDIHMMPKPLQPGGVPVWVSGTVNARVVERIIRFGCGWIPWGPAAADVGPSIQAIKSRITDAGGDPTSLQVTAPLPAVRGTTGQFDLTATMDQVAPLVAAGVTDVRLGLSLPQDRAAATAVLFEVVSAFRSTAGRTDNSTE